MARKNVGFLAGPLNNKIRGTKFAHGHGSKKRLWHLFGFPNHCNYNEEQFGHCNKGTSLSSHGLVTFVYEDKYQSPRPGNLWLSRLNIISFPFSATVVYVLKNALSTCPLYLSTFQYHFKTQRYSIIVSRWSFVSDRIG